jgi:methylphosphotriester-DNA--protein-cysteine methyltransferase
MFRHRDFTSGELYIMLRKNKVSFGGNMRLKIYGTLQCGSGKIMKKENRVFFNSEKEAVTLGYRPCGKCMRKQYLDWRNNRKPLAHGKK